MPPAQQPTPPHVALRPRAVGAQACSGLLRPQGRSSQHAGEPANRGPSSLPGPQETTPPSSAHPRQTHPAVEAPRKVPEASVELGGGGGGGAVRVSRKVRPDLGRGLRSSPLQCPQGGRRGAERPGHGKLSRPPRSPSWPGGGGARPRLGLRGGPAAGRTLGGRSETLPSGGVRPRLPGKRPRP